jgi:hypothetical protein
MKLGIDFGGVITPGDGHESDVSFFGPDFLKKEATEGMFEALEELNRHFEEVHIVSKCGSAVQDKTLKWLEHHKFYTRTGITRARVHFCRDRKDKADIATKLGLTAFIDDRLEILTYLIGICDRLICFRGQASEVKEWQPRLCSGSKPARVLFTSSWADVLRDLKG